MTKGDNYISFYDLKGEDRAALVSNFDKLLKENIPTDASNLRLLASQTWDDADVVVSFERKKKMIVYAFDVDETLEISGGPVKLNDLMQLRIQGHIVGICGNWAVLTQHYPGWQHLVSFISVPFWMEPNGTTPSDKAVFLALLKHYTPADDYVMVGNILGVSGASDDQGAAVRAGWRFIKESDFAAGAR